MLKSSEKKILGIHLDILCSLIKVCGKKIFCVAYVKKIKTCHMKIYFGSPEIIIFTQPLKHVISLHNLVCEHRMSRCTPRILFRIF
jgi:hypothetical protein